MPERVAVGVDIGETQVDIAAVDRDGQVIAAENLLTLPDQGASDLLSRISAGIQRVTDASHLPVIGIGVGCPGAVDSVRGVSLFTAKPGDGWQNLNLRRELKAHLNLPEMLIYVENDVNTGGLGQMMFGTAKGCDNFIYMLIDAGLRGCAVIDGRMLRGANFSALEVGHVTFNPNGRPGDFGLHGTAEMYASEKGFIAGWQELRHHYPESHLSRRNDVTPADILQAAREGDWMALHILDQAGEALGIALAWTVTVLNPSLVLIGGGLGIAAGDLLLDRAKAIIQARILPQTYDVLRFDYANHITSAVGAAALVWHEIGLERTF